MKKGTRVQHIKQPKFVGIISSEIDSVIDGKQVKLFSVKWDDYCATDGSIPLRSGDEGSHGKKGYLLSELKEDKS